jgi:hypothetical protein
MAHITAAMSVREINAKYPACRLVFAKYGMGGCGGDLGPDEPLDFFASAHHVDLRALSAELEQAAASGEMPPDTVSPALEFEQRLAKLYKAYIRTAIAMTLTLGTAWGAWILLQISFGQSFAASNYAGTQAHGHAQIFGWVGLFIMGVAYFSAPKFMQTRLSSLEPAWMAFGLMVTGILLRALAQPFATRPLFASLLPVSAAAELGAIAIFVTDMALILSAGKGKERRPYLPFLFASLGWMAVLAVWNAVLVTPLWQQRFDVIGGPANSAFLYAAVFGFIGNMILGYSLRLLPVFLGLRPTWQDLLMPALVLYNLGVGLRTLGGGFLGGELTFAGMAVYILALRIFEPAAHPVKARGVDRSFPWFIRLAYTWFAVAVTMVLAGDLYAAFTGGNVPHIYTGSWRHAVTVGFVSTIMIGLGYRLLPMFTGVDLWRPELMRATFWLLATGNTIRVVFELATAGGQRWSYLVMGSSGILELSAFTLFGVAIWKTLSRRQQVLVCNEQIGPKTNLRWLLDNFAVSRSLLIGAGLTHLAHVDSVPYFVTLEQAARVHGVDCAPIIERLRAELFPRPAPAPAKVIQIDLRKAS